MKGGTSHLLYEEFRDPARKDGEVLGQYYPTREEYRQALYAANKALWKTVDEATGRPLQTGDVVLPGLKQMVRDEATRKKSWSAEDYTFVPFAPQPPIAFHQSSVRGAEWVNMLKVDEEIEEGMTGLKFPHGYRITASSTADEHDEHARSKLASGSSSGGGGGSPK